MLVFRGVTPTNGPTKKWLAGVKKTLRMGVITPLITGRGLACKIDLGGDFKHFFFTPKLEEMIQFDDHILC